MSELVFQLHKLVTLEEKLKNFVNAQDREDILVNKDSKM